MSSAKFKTYIPSEHDIPTIHHLLLGGVAPRPIALVSTISKAGVNNLSPFSFFNAFGANPPTVAFSPSLRGRDGSSKDTLNNLNEIPECVISSVSYDMVEQVSLASTEYDSDIDEFVKSGLTPLEADLVKPKRVAQSPFQMECKLNQIVSLGGGKASGNLVICEVIKFHVREDVFKNGVIHPDAINLVGRNSANFYTKAFDKAIFEIEKPIGKNGIGFDRLPKFVQNSFIFSANNLARLANCENIPSNAEIEKWHKALKKVELSEPEVDLLFGGNNHEMMAAFAVTMLEQKHIRAKSFVEIAAKTAIINNDLDTAWKLILLLDQQNH